MYGSMPSLTVAQFSMIHVPGSLLREISVSFMLVQKCPGNILIICISAYLKFRIHSWNFQDILNFRDSAQLLIHNLVLIFPLISVIVLFPSTLTIFPHFKWLKTWFEKRDLMSCLSLLYWNTAWKKRAQIPAARWIFLHGTNLCNQQPQQKRKKKTNRTWAAAGSSIPASGYSLPPPAATAPLSSLTLD